VEKTVGGRLGLSPPLAEGIEKAGTRLRRTSLKTFRLPEGLLLLLEREAEAQGTTLSALVSSILTNYIEWDVKARKFGFIPVYKPIFTMLSETPDVKALDQIGRNALLGTWKEMTEYWFQESSPEMVLQFLEFQSRYIPYVQTGVRRQGNSYTVVLHHDLGPTWSVVYRGALDELARRMFKAQPVIDMGNTVVKAYISVP
jgi:hypothetical protein